MLCLCWKPGKVLSRDIPVWGAHTPFAVGYKGLLSPKKNWGLPGPEGHVC